MPKITKATCTRSAQMWGHQDKSVEQKFVASLQSALCHHTININHINRWKCGRPGKDSKKSSFTLLFLPMGSYSSISLFICVKMIVFFKTHGILDIHGLCFSIRKVDRECYPVSNSSTSMEPSPIISTFPPKSLRSCSMLPCHLSLPYILPH